MKKDSRDRVDELFFSKLNNFEVETEPGDWEAIADRLPRKAPVPLYRTIKYWTAAAVIALLLVTGSLYLFEREENLPVVAQEVEKETKKLEERMAEDISTLIAPAGEEPQQTSAKRPVLARSQNQPEEDNQLEKTVVQVIPADVNQEFIIDENTELKQVEERTEGDDVDVEPQLLISVPENDRLLTDAGKTTKSSKEKPARKWGFGAGGGSLSLGADNVLASYVTNSSGLKGENLSMLNSDPFYTADKEMPKTDIKHKTPVSFGVSVSRYLTGRIAVQTGLTYTYLSSEWKTNGKYHGRTHQGLHYIGMPLSATYLIAEWNKFNFYGTAGVMTEVNVSGELTTKLYSEDEKITTIKEDVRMKDWMWSLNARVGVSYPVVKFVNAFAETGVSYYFDNGSKIETVRSQRPCNVAFQFGLRLGF